MAVYTSRNRTDASPNRASESKSEFFERIAGPFWDQVRDVINEWWSHLPDHAQSGLRSRLLDRNSDTNVFSALWELYLHEMLLGSGCTVELEPGIGTRGKNPDFLVTRDGKQFVVEAIWTTQRLGDPGTILPPHLNDAIDSVPSPNFFVSCEIEKTGSATPPQKRLKSELMRWLADLDPDRVIAEHERDVPLPKYTWQEAGWCLSFEAIPRSPGKRGDPTSRTIGIYPAMDWLDNDSERVFDAVKRKGGKYGDLELPFIVAVGHAAAFPEDEDIETALYGSSVEYSHAGAPTFGRRPDGYWTATYNHAHGRVSGVLIVDNPAPWTWAKRTPVLWQSPDPSSPPVTALPTWATAQLVGIQVEHQSAAHPTHTALGLSEHWPIGEAFPRHHQSNPA
ncbi:hypothetical protein [Streptomyces sp. SID3212]|uniref:hypothetical protein n=1 Tax=Streptomyces sp. SID3212 TaxID=2690259 RepID=UPI001368EAA4|nr:hypothetical protein [Streptomyces sp. SID3212]MYV53719.1 hypothetical protein [Streptomyces sp. SID3212]